MKIHAWWAAAALLVASNLPARAQLTAALDAVPDDAMAIVVVKNIGEASAKLSALGKRANFPAFDALATAKKELGVDKGLDEKGTLIVALFAGDPEPLVVIFAPVTDYPGLLKQLKAKDASAEITETVGKAIVGKKAGFAVFAENKNRDLLKKVLASKKGIADAVQPVAGWLEKQDAGFVLTAKGVKEMAKHAQTSLETAKAALANAPEEAQVLVGWLESIDGLLKSAGADVSHIAGGIDYQQQSGDLTVTKRALFVKGSGFAKAAAGIKAPAGGVLAGLPGGDFMMAGGGSLPENFMTSMSNLGLQAMKGQLPADKFKKLQETYALSTKGITGMSMVMGIGKANDPLFSGTVAVMNVEDSKAYLDGYAKAIDAMNEVFKGANAPGLPSYSAKKVKVGDLEAVEVVTDMSAMAAADPNIKRLFEAMFGPGAKMTASLAPVDKTTIVMSYVPAKQIKDLVQAVKDKKAGLSDDAEVKKANALLPKDPQWAFYINPGGIVEFGARMVKAAAPIPIPIPAYPKSAPWAFAAKVDGNELEARVALTGSAIEALGVYIQKVKGIAEGNVN